MTLVGAFLRLTSVAMVAVAAVGVVGLGSSQAAVSAKSGKVVGRKSGKVRIYLRTDLDRTVLGGNYSVAPHKERWSKALESGLIVQPFTAKTAAEILVHLEKDFGKPGRPLETAFGAENGAVLYLPASQYQLSSVKKQLAVIRRKGYEHAQIEAVEKGGIDYHLLRIGRTIEKVAPAFEQAKRAIPELLAFSDLDARGFFELTNLPIHLSEAALAREHDLGFYLPGKAQPNAEQRETLVKIAVEHGLTFAGGGWGLHFLEGDKGLAAKTLDNLDRDAAQGGSIFTVHAGDNDNDRHSLVLGTVDLAVVVKAKGTHHQGLVDALAHKSTIAQLTSAGGLEGMRGAYLTGAEAPDALPHEVLKPLLDAAGR